MQRIKTSITDQSHCCYSFTDSVRQRGVLPQLPAAALHHFASDPAILTNRSMMGGVAALRVMLCCLVGG